MNPVPLCLLWAAVAGGGVWFVVDQTGRNRRGAPDVTGDAVSAAVRRLAGRVGRQARQARGPLVVATIFAVIVGMSAPSAAAATDEHGGNSAGGNDSGADGGTPAARPHSGPTRERIKFRVPARDQDAGRFQDPNRGPGGRTMSGPQDTKNTDEFDGKSNMPGEAGDSVPEVITERIGAIGDRAEGIGNLLQSGSSTATVAPGEVAEPTVPSVNGGSTVIGTIGAAILGRKVWNLGKAALGKLAGNRPADDPSAQDASETGPDDPADKQPSGRAGSTGARALINRLSNPRGSSYTQVRRGDDAVGTERSRQAPAKPQDIERPSESGPDQVRAQQATAEPAATTGTTAAQEQADEQAQAAAAQSAADAQAASDAQAAQQAQEQQEQQAEIAASQQEAAASQEQEQEQENQAEEAATEAQSEAVEQESATEAANAEAEQENPNEQYSANIAAQNAAAAAASRPAPADDGAEEDITGSDDLGDADLGDVGDDSGTDADTSDAPTDEAPADDGQMEQMTSPDGSVPGNTTMSPEDATEMFTGGVQEL